MKKGIAKVLKSALFVGIIAVAGGCASAIPQGILYTEVKLPVSSADGQVLYTRSGSSEAKSFLGLVAFGDASITQAVQSGGIKQIKYVDYQATNFLGILGTYKTTVYGD
ncbi:MAG TPA: TRL-like family protein [Victivallales bacterium]|nr:TRL-like family protein [Victivallales bacterium]